MEQTGKAFLRSSRHAALLALCYFAAVMIPNCILFFTEPYSIWSKAALLTLPAGGYLLWSVAFRRSGIAVWLSFPVIFFCALQIVLLYLFGNSVAATDMFINIVTTNPGEATELLSNIYPSVILVCVIYLPLLWTATVHVRRKVDFSPRFRRRTAVVGGVLVLVGAGLLIPAYQTKRHVLRNEIFPVNVAYNVVLCAREYVKIENYDRTSAGFRYHARRTAKADKREIYVYVIGEASRAANWELYGYDRPTNPRLKALGDEIVVFRNMLTQSNTTHKSVPMILSSVRTNEHDELFRRKGLPALFNEAGFRTWFLSNQSPQGAMIDKLARDADSLIYMGHPRYDMQLLDTMKRIVEADTENDLLFILHCYGSHFSYHQRYPREAAYFLPDDDVAIERQHKQKIWNAYDNSIRYTDTFLSSVIGYLASLDACSALLYSADHGEDMLDDERVNTRPALNVNGNCAIIVARCIEEAKKKTADEIMSVLQAGNVPCTVLRGIGDKYKEQEQLDQCLSNGYLGEGTYESGKHYYQPQIPIYMESVGVQNYFAQSKSIGADNDALFAEFSK